METKERFDELVTAVEMLPPMESWSELGYTPDTLVFPRGTEGLTEALGKALICYAYKQDETFRNALMVLLYNSVSINLENGLPPKQSDLEALAIMVNIGWLESNVAPIFTAYGEIQKLLEFGHDHDLEIELPSLACAIFQSPTRSKGLESLDPYTLLQEGE
jgi:hypothetical protein